MKKIAFIFSLLIIGFSANASAPESENNLSRGYDGNSYIFVEGEVEFSVFPDGQFDFIYIGPQKGTQVTINSPNVNISFNSGYNYDAFVQYDDYGAVIQVENVPIFYDEYGCIIQAGNVDIRYNDRRIVRVGGLHVMYNRYGYFSHYTGVINVFNPYYVYRPWHAYYAPPVYTHCIVYDMPYRRYYTPVRYSYQQHIVYYKNRHKVAYHNAPREFYRPGSRIYDKNGRATVNRTFDPDRKNTMIASSNSRGNNASQNNTVRNNNAQVKNSSTRTNSSVRNNNTQVKNRSTSTIKTANSTPRVITRNSNANIKAANNRNSTVIRNNAPAPKRESASRSTINNSHDSARNNSRATAPRVQSSRDGGTRAGRG